MPIARRTPIEEQASWRVIVGLLVSALFAVLFFVTPILVVFRAEDGANPVVLASVVAAFWSFSGVCIFSAWKCLAELRSRRSRPAL